MAYARVTFNNSDHSVANIEVGLDSLDEPAVLQALVTNTYALWRMAVEDAEGEQ